MDFNFSEEYLQITDLIGKFAKEKLEPSALHNDTNQIANIDALKELGELGVLGLSIPEKYGGTDFGAMIYAGVILELSKSDASTAVAVSVHNSLTNEIIYKFGTDQQKENYLPKLATGEHIGAFSLSEPDSGSDPGAMNTIAVEEDDAFVINGVKNFVTSGCFADVFILFAVTDKELGHSGISAFIIEKDTPGFSVTRKEHKMGLGASCTAELLLDNCRVPKENLIGEKGDGLKIALKVLDGGRIGIAAQAIGIAEAAYEEAVKYSKERKQFGKPLSKMDVIRTYIAEMAVDIEVAKTMLFKTAWMKEQGDIKFTRESAILKLFATEMSRRVVNKSLQIHGGYGYMKDYKIERLYREQRVTEIYEGTSEIQKLVIARDIFK